jgi:hypothetical protein
LSTNQRVTQTELSTLRVAHKSLQLQMDNERRDHDATVRSLQAAETEWQAKWRDAQANDTHNDAGNVA